MERDQALFDLYQGSLIGYDEALRYADSVTDLRLAIRLQSKRFQQNPKKPDMPDIGLAGH